MKTLAFTVAASADLNSIWDYTEAEWSVAQAQKYTTEIRDVCHALASGQKRARATSVRAGYMKYPCGAHVVYFRDLGDMLEIVRVLHRAQDAERNLHE
jgi:toxin ParE1/3/4